VQHFVIAKGEREGMDNTVSITCYMMHGAGKSDPWESSRACLSN